MKEQLHELGKQFNLYPTESTQYEVCFDDTLMCPIFLAGFIQQAENLFGIKPTEWFIERCELNNNNLIFGTDAI